MLALPLGRWISRESYASALAPRDAFSVTAPRRRNRAAERALLRRIVGVPSEVESVFLSREDLQLLVERRAPRAASCRKAMRSCRWSGA